jgi:hypothetical protein
MKNLLVVLMIIIGTGSINAQDLVRPESSKPTVSTDIKLPDLSYSNSLKSVQSINAGGLFIAPFIGFEFPLQQFSDNSKSSFVAGVRLEFAHSKIYPFVVGGLFQYESHEGTDEIKTSNFLSTFKTNITSFGGSVDIILNKYIKSDFTIPFATIEVKVMNIQREILPDNFNPGFALTDNVIGIGGGLGFTVFIFDIYTVYNYAGDYSTVGIKTRFHFPLIKF